MTETEQATAALEAFGRTIGVALPAVELVQLGAFIASKFRGASWHDAIQAGADAAAAVRSEEEAEASRLKRVSETNKEKS